MKRTLPIFILAGWALLPAAAQRPMVVRPAIGVLPPVPPIVRTSYPSQTYRDVVRAAQRSKPNVLLKLMAKHGRDEWVSVLNSREAIPPIYYAICAFRPENLKILLEYGADPNLQISDEVFRDFMTTVRARAKIAGDANIVGSVSPFSYVCMLSTTKRSDVREMMKILLDAGANPNLPAFEGRHPAMVLIEDERREELDLLAEYPVEIDDEPLATYIRENERSNSLVRDFVAKCRNARRRAEKNGTPEARARRSRLSAIERAVKSNDVDALRRACAREKDMEALRGKLTRALPLAVESGANNAFSMMLSLGADLDKAEAPDGEPFLFFVIRHGGFLMIPTCAEAGLDVDARDPKSGLDPLLFATSVKEEIPNRAESVRALLKAGAKPDSHGKDKKTPLMFAAARGDAEVAEILLKARAKRTARDAKGRTAETYLKNSPSEEVRALARRR